MILLSRGCSGLTSVTIPDSVETIGSNAFNGCTKLESVTLPTNDEFKTISTYAFSNCIKLQSITIPNNVETIGDSAFLNCVDLNSVTLPINESFTEISDRVFMNCQKLISITIPDSVTSISSNAFNYSGLKYLGVILDSPLLAADADGDGTVDVTIGSVQTIGGKDVYVYYTSKTLFIDTSGNEYLIDINGEITSSDYPDGITVNNLKSVVLGTNVLTIGDNAFEDCTSLISITISIRVESISDNAFQGGSGLKYLGVTVDSPLLAADADGDGTVDVTIGSAQTIGGKDVYVYDSSKTLFIDTSGNEYLIDINGITSSDYPDGITVNNLKSVVLGTNVLTIGDNAFEGCTSLTEIIIPDSVYTIIDFAFQGCSGLTAINILPNNSFYSSINGVLFDKTQTELIQYPAGKPETTYTIPNSVTLIGDNAFQGSGLKYLGVTVYSPLLAADADGDGTVDVTIGSAQTIGGKDVYVYDTSKTLFIDTDDANFTDNIVEEINSGKYPDDITANNLKSVVLGTNVLTIGNYAFKGCTSLTEIIIPDSVTAIGEDAFRGCTSLESVNIHYDVTEISIEAFMSCSVLTSVTLPKNDEFTTISNNTFNACTSLEKIDIPNSVRIIGRSAFWDCRNLASVTFQETSKVASIGEYAFYYCTSLEKIIIPNSVRTIGDDSFNGCSDLTSVTLPINDEFTTISNSAFNACTSLEKIIIPNSVHTIGDDSFNGCSDLTSVTLPINDEFTTISNSAFQGLLRFNICYNTK